MDRISLVISLLHAGAKELYYSIHVYMHKDAAIRNKRPFDPNNILRTWEGIRKRLVSSFGGHLNQDRTLRK